MKTNSRVQFRLLKKDPLPRNRRSNPATLTVKFTNPHFCSKYGRNEIQAQVYERTTFAELRAMVVRQLGIPNGADVDLSAPRFSVHGIKFTPDLQENLGGYGMIQRNTELSWWGYVRWAAQIFVKTLTGKTVALNVSSDDT